ncbi:uncharacterized protein LOC121389555 isoform X2 [Gigantopelta aegis]|uniref:uncharacterized protein LOC121389555 isoform X2 n=1 Tax=Gigantopelta aegis TaxID=1735272 RepID=UPI001B888CEF|nr:uncharacterized protein LOC121389555 isoform X2 [Gigantopelta aegis]
MDSSVTNCEAEFCDSVHSLELHADQDEFHSTVSRLYLNLKDIDNGQTSLNESDVSLIKPETEKNVVINQNVENKDKQDGHLWRNLIISFGLLNLIWISAIVVLHVEIIPPTGVRTRHVFTEVHDDFCVPCDAVYLTEDDVHDNIHRFKKRDDDCCVGKESTLTDIVTKFADKQYCQQRARGFDSGRPDGTHTELNDRSAELRQIDVHQCVS